MVNGCLDGNRGDNPSEIVGEKFSSESRQFSCHFTSFSTSFIYQQNILAFYFRSSTTQRRLRCASSAIGRAVEDASQMKFLSWQSTSFAMWWTRLEFWFESFRKIVRECRRFNEISQFAFCRWAHRTQVALRGGSFRGIQMFSHQRWFTWILTVSRRATFRVNQPWNVD